MNKKTLAIACLIALGTGSVAFAHGGFGPGKRLEELDANSDGKVTKAELKKEADEHFAQLDVNKDGRVTADEAKAFAEARHAEHAKHAKDGKGPHGHPDFEQKMQERGQHHFARRDQNGDGVIDRAEHERAVEERFARMDDDKNGVLSGDELHPRRGRGPREWHGRGRDCDHDHDQADRPEQGKGKPAPSQGAAGGSAVR